MDSQLSNIHALSPRTASLFDGQYARATASSRLLRANFVRFAPSSRAALTSISIASAKPLITRRSCVSCNVHVYLLEGERGRWSLFRNERRRGSAGSSKHNSTGSICCLCAEDEETECCSQYWHDYSTTLPSTTLKGLSLYYTSLGLRERTCMLP